MSYLLHGATLALAWFFALNAALSVLVALLARVARRPAALLMLRLLPAAGSILFVAIVFVPSYWRFEPREFDEGFALTLMLAAAASGVLLVKALLQGVAAWRRAAVRARALDADGRTDRARCRHSRLQGRSGAARAGARRDRALAPHRDARAHRGAHARGARREHRARSRASSRVGQHEAPRHARGAGPPGVDACGAPSRGRVGRGRGARRRRRRVDCLESRRAARARLGARQGGAADARCPRRSPSRSARWSAAEKSRRACGA